MWGAHAPAEDMPTKGAHGALVLASGLREWLSPALLQCGWHSRSSPQSHLATVSAPHLLGPLGLWNVHFESK